MAFSLLLGTLHGKGSLLSRHHGKIPPKPLDTIEAFPSTEYLNP